MFSTCPPARITVTNHRLHVADNDGRVPPGLPDRQSSSFTVVRLQVLPGKQHRSNLGHPDNAVSGHGCAEQVQNNCRGSLHSTYHVPHTAALPSTELGEVLPPRHAPTQAIAEVVQLFMGDRHHSHLHDTGTVLTPEILLSPF